jgi:tetratricopeptide (TPR) repeat protein
MLLNSFSSRISLILVMLGLLTQGLMLHSSRDDILDLPLIDEATYHRQAISLTDEHAPPPTRPYWQPPLYPHVLAWIYGDAEDGAPLKARRLQCLLTALTALLTFLCGRFFMDEKKAAAAAILVCLCGPLLFFNSRLLPTGLATCLNMLMLWLTLRAASTPSIPAWLAAGLSLGLAAVTVPNVLIMIPVVGAWMMIVMRPTSDRRTMKHHAAATVAGLALCILPVLIHNIRVSGEWVPISTNGGINLYIGNNPRSEDTIAARPGSSDWRTLAAMPHQAGIQRDSDADRWFKKQVLHYVLHDPFSFLGGLLEKSIQFVNGYEIPRNLDVYSLRDRSWFLSATTWRIGSFAFPGSLILPLAVLGVLLRIKKRDLSHIAMGYLVLYSVSVILFFPAARYRVPILPVALLFAVVGASWLWQERKQARSIAYLSRAGVSLGMLVISCLPLSYPTDATNFDAELYNAAGSGFAVRGKQNTALHYYQLALAENPESAEACYNIALIYQGLGDREEALDWHARALTHNPNHSGAHNSLGILFYQEKNLVDARDSFSRAVRADALNFRAWNNLGLVYAASNDMQHALQAFSTSVHIQKDFYEGYMNMAMIYDHEGEHPKALEMLRYILSRQPDAASARALEQKILKETGQPGKNVPVSNTGTE